MQNSLSGNGGDSKAGAMIRLEKGCITAVSRHFSGKDFDCHCDRCKETLISEELVKLLDLLWDMLGVQLKINSGYRCESYQNELTAKGFQTSQGLSRHVTGEAADISTGIHTGIQLEPLARSVGFQSIGTGKMFVHVDIRGISEDVARIWDYPY